jgi:hypothetical protein
MLSYGLAQRTESKGALDDEARAKLAMGLLGLDRRPLILDSPPTSVIFCRYFSPSAG